MPSPALAAMTGICGTSTTEISAHASVSATSSVIAPPFAAPTASAICPPNTGYFDGPFAYGEDTFSAYTVSDVYGPNPAGVPVGAYYQVSRVVNGTGADPKFPAIYGSGQLPRFDRHDYLDGKVQQWNLVLESRLGRNWQVSGGYAGNTVVNLPLAR